MEVRFFNPGLGYQNIKDEVLPKIDELLSKGDLILRSEVEDFEKSLAEFVGTKYAVGLNSGTDALYLALKAIGIKEGDEVLVPSHTFVATAQVVAQIGATPVLYDIWEMPKPTEKTKAILVAHIAGELSPLPETDLPIIEDACQALGAVKNPKTIAQCWSFYPAKILGAYGDAGGLTTDNQQVYDYVTDARNHFKTDYSEWGINSRLDNIQAAVLNIKLKYLPQTLARRQEVAEMYLKGLEDLDLNGVVQLPENKAGRVWQDFILNVGPHRDELYDLWKSQGIETMKNEYPFPIQKGPNSLEYEAETLRLPINELITDDEVNYVIEKIKEFYGTKVL